MRSRRSLPWLAAAAGLAVFQVLGSLGAAEDQVDRRAIDAVAVLVLLVGPAAVAVVWRWPLVAAAAALGAADLFIGLGYPYGPVFFSAIVCLFAAVQHGRRRAAWAVAVVGYVGFVVAHALDSRTKDLSALGLAVVAGWLAVVVTVAEVVRTRREQTAERARAAEEERQRRVGEQRLGLAQELHDVLAHNISMINVQASVALHLIDEQPDQVRPALASIKDASREALRELRTALDVLRRGHEAPLDPAPRLADLERLVAVVRSGGLDVRLEQAPAPPSLPAAVELAAYRIAQEALTNVARHAGARSATVRVGYAGGVTVEVLDDGVGSPASAAAPGNGITGMRERAAALGGTVEAGPRQGGGFRVLARLPVAAPDDPPVAPDAGSA